jgi:hypothetical protein
VSAPWPDSYISLILGCGTINLPTNPNNDNERDTSDSALKKGQSQLLGIIISESAHLIWTLRCEKVIRERTHSDDHITKRWVTAIEKRLQTDHEIASKTKRDCKTINKVKNTWCDVISSTQTTYHDDWVINLEVLVGIKLPRPS